MYFPLPDKRPYLQEQLLELTTNNDHHERKAEHHLTP